MEERDFSGSRNACCDLVGQGCRITMAPIIRMGADTADFDEIAKAHSLSSHGGNAFVPANTVKGPQPVRSFGKGAGFGEERERAHFWPVGIAQHFGLYINRTGRERFGDHLENVRLFGDAGAIGRGDAGRGFDQPDVAMRCDQRGKFIQIVAIKRRRCAKGAMIRCKPARACMNKGMIAPAGMQAVKGGTVKQGRAGHGERPYPRATKLGKPGFGTIGRGHDCTPL